jgi:hypothetical protein
MTSVHVRVAALLSEVITERGQPLRHISVDPNTLRRVTSGKNDYVLSSLVGIAAALGYEVVINLRESA